MEDPCSRLPRRVALGAVLLAMGAACGGSTEDQTGAAGTGGAAALIDGGGGALDSDANVDRSVLAGDADADTGDACAPEPLGTWQPKWTPPKPRAPTACTSTQIDDYIVACVTTSDDAVCAAFLGDLANTTCLSCVLTTEDEPAYGAVVIRQNYRIANIPGCMAFIDNDMSASGCGAKYQAADACKQQACYAPCRTHSYEAYDACRAAAGGTVCLPYTEQRLCGQNARYTPCDNGGTFADWVRQYAIMFCATAPDGGSGVEGGVDGAILDAAGGQG